MGREEEREKEGPIYKVKNKKMPRKEGGINFIMPAFSPH